MKDWRILLVVGFLVIGIVPSYGGGPDSGSVSPPVVGVFSGTWDTTTGESHLFTMTLNQTPDGIVNGSYIGPNGSGTITGQVNSEGKLVYQWSQQGSHGSGIFELGPDGRTFSGTYSNSDDPSVINGSWYGTRKE